MNGSFPPKPPSRPSVPPTPYAPPMAQHVQVPQQGLGSTEEERTLGMLCHLLGILTGFLGPLILWLVKKDSSRYVDHHGRESLNFQLTLMLVMTGLGVMIFVLMFFVIGILLVPVMMILGILALVAEILAAVAAQRGEWHRYPLTIRFV
jgi:uncharacterized protein